MTLIPEIIDIKIKDSGEQFKNKMYDASAKLILKEGEVIVYEQVFSEKHRDIYSITDTMEKIRIKMSKAKAIIESECALKIEAEKEVQGMLGKIVITEVK